MPQRPSSAVKTIFMKPGLYISCIVATIVFFICSVVGFAVMSRSGSLLNILMGAVFSLIISSLLLHTKEISQRSDAMHRILRMFTMAAFVCATIALGYFFLYFFIIRTQVKNELAVDWEIVFDANISQKLLALVPIPFLIAAPIALSYMSWTSIHLYFSRGDDEVGLTAPPASGVPTQSPNKQTSATNSAS